jgi:membrane-associated protein
VAGLFAGFVDLFLHLDKHLGQVIGDYGTLTYLILFVVIFCETGLVVTPFLPGDSLLFAAGTFAAISALELEVLLPVLYFAPILGDSSNYWIGRFVGPKVFHREDVKLFKKEYLDKTHAFYEKHGGVTIIIARFMPIFRTFAPFVAGIGRMTYLRFLLFSVSGTLLWISSFVLAGYFFGNIPFVKKHFTLVILAVIFISLLPGIIAFMREKLASRAESPTKN